MDHPVPKGPPYRSSQNGWLTAVLFYERWTMIAESNRVSRPIFSFMGHPDYIDARKTFVECRDPTGYRWALKYLHSWAHFEKLCKADWFNAELMEWRSELAAKEKSDALQTINQIASEAGPQRYLAAKYISNQEHTKPAHNRGRPSRAELQGELRSAAAVLTREQEDAQRMGLELNPLPGKVN